MTESQTPGLQQNSVTELHDLLDLIVCPNDQPIESSLLLKMIQLLDHILRSRGLVERYHAILASLYCLRKSRKPRTSGVSSALRLETDSHRTPSVQLTTTPNGRDALSSVSVGSQDSVSHAPTLEHHNRPHDLAARRFLEEMIKPRSELAHLAEQDYISSAQNDIELFLKNLDPTDREILGGSDLEKLLHLRSIRRMSNEVLSGYYEDARALRNFVSRWSPVALTGDSLDVEDTQGSIHEDPYHHVLNGLKQTSKKAEAATIESRYYKVTLYHQIKAIETKLIEKSTTGVSLLSMAVNKWIERTEPLKPNRKKIFQWRKEGMRWAGLCGKFSVGILEVPCKVLSDVW
jgi:hypothetical protein